jgi:hypothetical protein
MLTEDRLLLGPACPIKKRVKGWQAGLFIEFSGNFSINRRNLLVQNAPTVHFEPITPIF